MTRREFIAQLFGGTALAATAPMVPWQKVWAWLHPVKVGWKSFYKPVVLNKWFVDKMLAAAEQDTVFYKLGKKVKLPMYGEDRLVSFKRYDATWVPR